MAGLSLPLSTLPNPTTLFHFPFALFINKIFNSQFRPISKGFPPIRKGLFNQDMKGGYLSTPPPTTHPPHRPGPGAEAALQCLVKIVSLYYDKLKPYMQVRPPPAPVAQAHPPTRRPPVSKVKDPTPKGAQGRPGSTCPVSWHADQRILCMPGIWTRCFAFCLFFRSVGSGGYPIAPSGPNGSKGGGRVAKCLVSFFWPQFRIQFFHPVGSSGRGMVCVSIYREACHGVSPSDVVHHIFEMWHTASQMDASSRGPTPWVSLAPPPPRRCST